MGIADGLFANHRIRFQSQFGFRPTVSIRFFPDGSSTGGHISLIEGKTEYRVNVDWLTGRIAIEDRLVQ